MLDFLAFLSIQFLVSSVLFERNRGEWKSLERDRRRIGYLLKN
jgi:hypothetical protein